MFAYCNNNPINYMDGYGTDPYAATAWASAMWWLCCIDTVLPIGDLIYAGGLFSLLLLTSVTLTGSTSNTGQNNASPAKSSTDAQSTFGAYTANKPVNLPSWKKLKVDMDHIASGHLPGGSRNPNGKKTVFWGLTVEQVYRAIREAYNNSSRIATQGDWVGLQGYSEEFGLVIEIWVNVVDKILKTAFPV